MKLNRRTFIRIVPIGAAVSAASWWFLGQDTQSTSTQDFPVTWNQDPPIMVDPVDYRLRVDGDVSNPLQLTLGELYAVPTVNRSLTIRCREGWSARVEWDGIPLSRLLSMAGAPSNYDHVSVRSITGYAGPLLAKIGQNDVAESDAMIGLKAGGFPLTVEHGYPARLVLPNRLGLEWVKCVTKITCIR